MEPMEVTEEQRRRAEANRIAALERRRKRLAAQDTPAWHLTKCSRIDGPAPSAATVQLKPQIPRFRVVIEICSPDEFSISPEPLPGVDFPGADVCRCLIEECIASALPFSFLESQAGRVFSVFKLTDHELVVKCLKKSPSIEIQDIPYTTRMVVQKFSSCVGGYWLPSLECHYTDEEVEELLKKLPKSLLNALLPFQLDGVKFGLRRGGRCLIADEMGLGKTLQAIAIACCFKDEGSILVVCPAVLRFTWAEEMEHWLPTLLPKDIHLVFGHQNSLDYLPECPKVVVISYKMLSHLKKSVLERKWAMMIVDESHNIRCTKKKIEKDETKTILQLAAQVKHIILLSGTPSLTRPYDIYHQIDMLWPRLLGSDKYEFAKRYCSVRIAHGCQGKMYQDFSKGIRLAELNILLRQSLMIRRLKEHVLSELPPKRRQIIRLKLKSVDIQVASSVYCGTRGSINYKKHAEKALDVLSLEGKINNGVEDEKDFNPDGNVTKFPSLQKSPRHLSSQEIGLAKLSGFGEWFSNHCVARSRDCDNLGENSGCQKIIIFAHHLKVLDGIQALLTELDIRFVRIDGSTLPRERKDAVDSFRLSSEVKVALVGITAGGVGLDFSSAQSVVFVELPNSASEMLQAEDRAHRRGQVNAVNIYIFCAKGTSDETHWMHLNRSLYRTSSVMNGKEDAIKEIEVDRVLSLSCGERAEHTSSEAVEYSTQEPQGSSDLLKECGSFSAEYTEVEDVFSIRTIPLHLEPREDCYADDLNLTGPINGQQLEQLDVAVSSSIPTKPESTELNVLKINVDNCFRVEYLHFEVSQHTSRIHLYSCIPGSDTRPVPMNVNFLPEEVEFEPKKMPSSVMKDTSCHLLKEPSFCQVIVKFIKEWTALRPIDQNKLLGKPLQLPLSLELCFVKESINHSLEGLLKGGGSKRRVTPILEVSNPLPENALWKKIVLRAGSTKEREFSQAWTLNNEPLCKLCQQHCRGSAAKSPDYFEDLFCNLSCFEEFRLRTSQRAIRQALFQIERGICSACKLDCSKLVKLIKPLSIEKRTEYIKKYAPALANRKKLLNKLVYEPKEGNAWHADHIIPVYKGGGECRLENMRTLCVGCHYEVTKAQRTERQLMRMKAKRQLQTIMKQLKDSSSSEIPHSEAADNADDPLLISVPGSSYCGSEINVPEEKTI